jgi:hypothetical protein
MLKAGTAARRQTLHGEGVLTASEVMAQVEQFLRALDAALQQADQLWVGHAKLLLSQDEHSFYASITAAGDQARWAGTPVDLGRAEVTLYAAIYGLTDAQVAAAVDDTLASTRLLAFPGVAVE